MARPDHASTSRESRHRTQFQCFLAEFSRIDLDKRNVRSMFSKPAIARVEQNGFVAKACVWKAHLTSTLIWHTLYDDRVAQ